MDITRSTPSSFSLGKILSGGQKQFWKRGPTGNPDYEIYTEGSRFKKQTGSGYIISGGKASLDDELVVEELCKYKSVNLST